MSMKNGNTKMKHNGLMSKFFIGMKGEILPYDFTDLGWEAKGLMESLHHILYGELMSRPSLTMWDWSIRTKNVFLRNKLLTVGNVVHVTIDTINNFYGCGYKTRKEVYNVFKEELNMMLMNWSPDLYWAKFDIGHGEDKDYKAR